MFFLKGKLIEPIQINGGEVLVLKALARTFMKLYHEE